MSFVVFAAPCAYSPPVVSAYTPSIGTCASPFPMYSLSRNIASATTPCTRASALNVVRSVSAHVPRRQPSRVNVVAARALAPSSHHSPLNDPRSALGYATGAFAAIAPRAVATTTIATTRVGVRAFASRFPRARVPLAPLARAADAIARVRVDARRRDAPRAARRARVCGVTPRRERARDGTRI